MQAIFVSSIQRDYDVVRGAVRRAVESLGMRPLMAESAGASEASPQRALLDLVAKADVLLLLVGSRYSRPTEEEFDEARRLARPILVLRQEGDLEPEQEAFLERVAGGWSGGRLWGTFADEHDVAFATVQAITNLGETARRDELAPAARALAAELAAGRRGQGYFGHGSRARVALVPLVAESLLDAVALDEPDLGEAIADLARAARLIPHSVGVAPRVTRVGVSLERAGGHANEPAVMVAPEGAVLCEIDIGGDDQFGGMRVDPALLEAGVRSVGTFALRVWERIDRREAVQQVAVVVAIPEAQNKVFGLPVGATGWSLGMSLPQLLLVPEPPAVVRRAEVAGDELGKRIVAEVRRVYADAGAVAR